MIKDERLAYAHAVVMWGGYDEQTRSCVLETIKEVDKELIDLKQKLEKAIETLEVLRVAVNDKQSDPGAVMFIDAALKQIDPEK